MKAKPEVEIRSDSRLKGMRDAIAILLRATEEGGCSAGWMCEKLGITREEGHRAGVPWIANLSVHLAETDYLKKEAKEMIS